MNHLRDLVRAALRVVILFQDLFICLFARIARRGEYVRERIAGNDPLQGSANAAVYVHFDKNGVVHDYVVHQLCELVGAGYRVTFVSNAPTLPAESRARVLPLCKDLLWRLNTGYDFGAYKDGIASIADIHSLDSLVLMNDSVYGPFWSLRDTVKAIDRSTCDFWGITDSFELERHVQTFFIVFFPAALKSSAFNNFWSRYPYVNHKRWVVRNAEVKLTQALERASLRSGVLAPYWTVVASMKSKLLRTDNATLRNRDRKNFELFRSRILRDRPINQMQYFWDVLIEDYRCPFIKRELIQSNPAKIPNVSQWRKLIATHSDYDVGMIERHLC